MRCYNDPKFDASVVKMTDVYIFDTLFDEIIVDNIHERVFISCKDKQRAAFINFGDDLWGKLGSEIHLAPGIAEAVRKLVLGHVSDRSKTIITSGKSLLEKFANQYKKTRNYTLLTEDKKYTDKEIFGGLLEGKGFADVHSAWEIFFDLSVVDNKVDFS